jgi:hypothetical protein
MALEVLAAALEAFMVLAVLADSIKRGALVTLATEPAAGGFSVPVGMI